MKAKIVLELDQTFDDGIEACINGIIAFHDDGAKNQEFAQKQQLINNIRAKVHRAFKLGLEAGRKS